jgi:hypothetical protein
LNRLSIHQRTNLSIINTPQHFRGIDTKLWNLSYDHNTERRSSPAVFRCINPRSFVAAMSSKPTTALPSTVTQSHFWKLPPELQDRIYEYVLYQPGWCTVTQQHGIPEPPLLFACKLTRKEALGIFYAMNLFQVDAPAFDPELYDLFAQKDNKHESYDRHVVGVCMDPRSPRHWRNLLAWLKGHHAGSLPRPWLHSNFTLRFSAQEAAFVASLFMITAGSRGRSWLEVEDVLVGLHSGLRAMHVGWS